MVFLSIFCGLASCFAFCSAMFATGYWCWVFLFCVCLWVGVAVLVGVWVYGCVCLCPPGDGGTTRFSMSKSS